ncbi:MAG: electron transport complex subunit RsxC [bacterium]
MKGQFKGGVHPAESKDTNKEAVKVLQLLELYMVSLSQHIGAPAEPIVSAGDKVLKYQEIARSTGFISASLHAPTSGTVKAIEPSPHPSGRLIPAIVIESDGEDREFDISTNSDPDLKKGPEAWKEMVRNAGIVGMGGAAFPTHVKLSPPDDKPIELMIANGIECEPYLTADHRLMLENPELVVAGLRLTMEMVGAKKAIIGVEANKPDAIETFLSLDLPPDIEVAELPCMYPQGAEKQLIYALLGKEVPAGGLPMDVGVVVQNVGTLAAIYDAVTKGKPLVERIMTLGGSVPAGPGNYLARIGMPLSDVVEQTGGMRGPAARIVSGGPMMGEALSSLESPVLKGTGGLLIFGAGEMRPLKQRACVRCGACIKVCPSALLPHKLGTMVEWSVFGELEGFHINDCIECGCCAYVCPSDRNLVQYIRHGKAEIMTRGHMH